jgi:hypothetical protein
MTAFPPVVFLGEGEDGSDGLTKNSVQTGTDCRVKYDHAAFITTCFRRWRCYRLSAMLAVRGGVKPSTQVVSEFSSKLMSLVEPVQEMPISGEEHPCRRPQGNWKEGTRSSSSNMFVQLHR